MSDVIKERGAVVEFFMNEADPSKRRILVNGTDVGLVGETWSVDTKHGLTTVTLTLIARRVVLE